MKFVAQPKQMLSLFVGLLIVAGLIWNGRRDRTDGAIDVNATSAKRADEIPVSDSDRKIEFNGDDCTAKWSCANVLGQVQVGYFYQLAGAALMDNDSQFKQLNIIFDMTEMRANAASLSAKLQGPGFFQTESFPTATFNSTSISKQKRIDDPEWTTHIVEANFQIRDVTKSVTIPVAFQAKANGFILESKFKLNRKDFGVAHPVALEDKAIHEEVVLDLKIEATPDHSLADIDANDAPEAELKSTVATSAEISSITNADRKSSVAETVDAATSQTVEYGDRFVEEIPTTLAQFEMIKVPGDAKKEIASFYLGKCEVTWEEFDYWALCKDLDEKDAVLMRNKLLRPSAPHNLEAIYRNWGRKDQPVVGVSRKSAELYCEWLSEQTGKKYRLPTSAEWLHALELGGQLSKLEQTDVDQVAWFEDNTLDEEGFDNRAMPVGTRKPNRLGIYDMLGNAAEWVSDKAVVRGGNFLTPADELSGEAEEAEDQKVWNATYPQLPKSLWWYKDADYVGFRVVCDIK